MSLVLAVIGVLLLALSVPTLAFPVVAHETVTFGWDPVVLGPYHLEAGVYFVWIENYFPGPDDYDIFYIETSDEAGLSDSSYHTSNKPARRTIEGVDCEQAGGFDDLTEGGWTFIIETDGETTEGNALHVFIVREDAYGHTILFGAGVVCLSLGLITNGLMYWARRSEGPGDDGMHGSAK